MPTAPGSLGIPFLGHTFALARGVTRYPCTWDLFSIWSRATAPVRPRGRGPRCAGPLRPRCRAGAGPRADIYGAVRRHRRPGADEARAADESEELWQGPGVLILSVHCASRRGRVLRHTAPHALSLLTCAGHLGHRAGHQRRRTVEQAAHADQLRSAGGDPGRHRRHCAARCRALGTPARSRLPRQR